MSVSFGVVGHGVALKGWAIRGTTGTLFPVMSRAGFGAGPRS